MPELRPCPYCKGQVGITNDKDFDTHLEECSQAPENLPCQYQKVRTCENFGSAWVVDFDYQVVCVWKCSLNQCSKQLSTVLFENWETGVPESEPLFLN